MAHKNLKIEKKKEYNPFVTRTIKRETVGKVKCYLKAVKQNQKDAYGVKKYRLHNTPQMVTDASLRMAEHTTPKRCIITKSAQMMDRIVNVQRAKMQKERSHN